MAGNAEAAICTCVICCFASRSASSSPGNRPAGGFTSVPPAASTLAISPIATSNTGDTKRSSRVAGFSDSRSACAAARLASARCGTITPFGSPVEPEVEIT